MSGADAGTWHHGLVARWWAEFTEPREDELSYLRRSIERFGQPALDLGCGSGRLLQPLLSAGLDVDGADVSADMIAQARAAAERAGFSPLLAVQATHQLDLPRRYRTIYVVGTFGIGGNRRNDREGLRRAYDHLEPGGALLINHELPYAMDEKRWARWLPGHRGDVPQPWPESGDRRRTADGDELELLVRTLELDPLAQRRTYEMRARRWRDGGIVEEEAHQLREGHYFAQEIVALLELTGFVNVTIESGYSGRPATAEDGEVMFVARRV